MKKILLIAISISILGNISFAKSVDNNKIDEIKQMYQQDLENLSNVLKEEFSEANIYANKRVKNMCKEWPTCEEWAKNNAVKNPKFQIIDAEIEHWITGWESSEKISMTKLLNVGSDKKDAIWGHRFYVLTRENEQIKAYVFKCGKKGLSYEPPVRIKKFPGHPIISEPTKTASLSFLFPYELTSWPGIEKWEGGALGEKHVSRGVLAQYIYKYDENNNALWKRVLYVVTMFHDVFYFESYQTEAGGAYTYKEPVEIKDFPYSSEWNFL